MTTLECVEILQDISWKLQRFKILKPGKLYNFRCPLCGDSKKSKLKARGYLYENPDKGSLYYKCHNCGASYSFINFLKRIDEEYYNNLLFKTKYIASNEVKDPEPPKTVSPISKADDQEHIIITKTDIEKAATSLYNLDNNHIAKSFACNRKIPSEETKFLYYADNFRNFISKILPNYEKLETISEDPRIIIPFFTKEFKVSLIQGRAILPTKLRYISVTINKSLPKIYGLHRNIQFDSDIYIVEGPIDSLFLPNSVAVGGSELMNASSVLPSEKLVYIFDNEPENKEIVKKMQTVINKGDRIVIFPKEIEQYGKDINDMILNGLSISELLDILKNNTFQGLEAEMEFKFWKK